MLDRLWSSAPPTATDVMVRKPAKNGFEICVPSPTSNTFKRNKYAAGAARIVWNPKKGVHPRNTPTAIAAAISRGVWWPVTTAAATRLIQSGARIGKIIDPVGGIL